MVGGEPKRREGLLNHKGGVRRGALNRDLLAKCNLYETEFIKHLR